MHALDTSRELPARSRRANPFSPEHSTYASYDGSKLVRVLGGSVTGAEEFVHDSFRGLILNPKFACVAAKSAIRSGHYRIGHYAQMPTRPDADTAEALAHDLFEFVVEQPSFIGFSTFVATFAEPIGADEAAFEKRLWSVLQSLHDLDVVHHDWDASVSSDPESADFSFSFAGRAFFLVGLHPAASRLTRRFAFPTLVFNSHAQFEELRREGKFGRMQEVIRARDIALQGTTNANLAAFGERSEALQYSGRPVEAGWRCPFQKRSR